MNILLVEDDVFFQKFYSTKLRDRSISVDVASNGEEGLRKVAEGNVDLILLDLVMPKVDGFEVLETLSKSKNTIPVLVFSTLGQEQDIEKAKSLGARDYFNKTFFNFDELLEKMNNLVK